MCGNHKVRTVEPIVYLSLAEFGRKLGVSPPRMSQLVHAGLPVLRSGYVELGLGLRWLKQTGMPAKSRYPDRGLHRVDALLRELAEGPGADAA